MELRDIPVLIEKMDAEDIERLPDFAGVSQIEIASLRFI